MHCPNCGSPNPEGSSFCGICGGSLEGGFAATNPSSAQRETYQVRGKAQEQSYVASSQAYRQLTCPACGQPTLQPRPDGQFADCDGCGSVVDIRSREVVVERHEHITNNITYASLDDQFVLSNDITVLEGLTGSGMMSASDLIIPANQGIRVIGCR